MNRDTAIRFVSFCLILATLSTMTAGLLLGRTARRSRSQELETISTLRRNLDEYAVLRIQADASEDYETLFRKLSRRQVRYDSRMNRHRQEIAVFTATRSGMQQGDAVLRSGESELQSGKQIYLIIDELFCMAELLFTPVDLLIDSLDTNHDGVPDAAATENMELILQYLKGIDMNTLRSLLLSAVAELQQNPSAILGEGIDAAYVLAAIGALLDQMNQLEALLSDSSLTAEKLFSHFGDLVAASAFMRNARILLDYVGWQITEGENELKKAREAINQEKEKLDAQARELEKEKLWLDQEEENLIRRRQEAENQKTCEERLTAIRSYLRSIPEIRGSLDENVASSPQVQEDAKLVAAAEGWYNTLTRQSQADHTRRISCMTMMLLPLFCAAVGFGITFRQKRIRGLELFLFALCLGCAVVAAMLYLPEHKGPSYSCIAVGAFAAVCFVLALPARPEAKDNAA